jgi:hypothetical protein
MPENITTQMSDRCEGMIHHLQADEWYENNSKKYGLLKHLNKDFSAKNIKKYNIF